MRKSNLWSDEEVKIMKQFYPIRTKKEMNELLPNKTDEQLYRKAKNLKLKKMKEVATKSRLEMSFEVRHGDDLWSDDEKKIVIEHYPKLGSKGVMDDYLPHRSEDSIKRIAYRLGVKRENQNAKTWIQEEVDIVTEPEISITISYKGV